MYTNIQEKTIKTFLSILKQQKPEIIDPYDFEQETTEIEFSKIQSILEKSLK